MKIVDTYPHDGHLRKLLQKAIKDFKEILDSNTGSEYTVKELSTIRDTAFQLALRSTWVKEQALDNAIDILKDSYDRL